MWRSVSPCQVGDILDRGDSELAIMRKFRSLAKEAQAAGGDFIMINGEARHTPIHTPIHTCIHPPVHTPIHSPIHTRSILLPCLATRSLTFAHSVQYTPTFSRYPPPWYGQSFTDCLPIVHLYTLMR